MDVAVVAQTHDGEADQGAHVEGQDGYEHGLHTLQVTVEQDGHEHNLPGESTEGYCGAGWPRTQSTKRRARKVTVEQDGNETQSAKKRTTPWGQQTRELHHGPDRLDYYN